MVMAAAVKRLFSFFLKTVGLLTVLTAIFGLTGIYFAGDWLVVNERPAKSDAIILLAGNLTRPLYGADLYHKGYAPVIYISKAERDEVAVSLEKIGIEYPSQEDFYREILIRKKVPPEAIRFFGTRSISTIEEAEALKRTLGDRPVRLLLVTSPSHTRRAQLVFRDLFRKAEISMVATPYETFEKRWWSDQASALKIFSEMCKIVFYEFGGAFRSGP